MGTGSSRAMSCWPTPRAACTPTATALPAVSCSSRRDSAWRTGWGIPGGQRGRCPARRAPQLLSIRCPGPGPGPRPGPYHRGRDSGESGADIAGERGGGGPGISWTPPPLFRFLQQAGGVRRRRDAGRFQSRRRHDRGTPVGGRRRRDKRGAGATASRRSSSARSDPGPARSDSPDSGGTVCVESRLSCVPPS